MGNHHRYSKRDTLNSKTMNESFNLLKGVTDENGTGVKEKYVRKEFDESRVFKDKTVIHSNIPKTDKGNSKEKADKHVEKERKEAAKEEFSKLSLKDKVLRVLKLQRRCYQLQKLI